MYIYNNNTYIKLRSTKASSKKFFGSAIVHKVTKFKNEKKKRHIIYYFWWRIKWNTENRIDLYSILFFFFFWGWFIFYTSICKIVKFPSNNQPIGKFTIWANGQVFVIRLDPHPYCSFRDSGHLAQGRDCYDPIPLVFWVLFSKIFHVIQPRL